MDRPDIDYATILRADVLIVLLIALVLGAIGGLTRAAARFTDGGPPPWTRGQIASNALVGAVAGVAALYAAEPATALTFVAASLVAGYAGPALLDALEARLRLSAAQARARAALDVGDRAVAAADAALQPAPVDASAAPPTARHRADLEVLRAEISALRAEL